MDTVRRLFASLAVFPPPPPAATAPRRRATSTAAGTPADGPDPARTAHILQHVVRSLPAPDLQHLERTRQATEAALRAVHARLVYRARLDASPQRHLLAVARHLQLGPQLTYADLRDTDALLRACPMQAWSAAYALSRAAQTLDDDAAAGPHATADASAADGDSDDGADPSRLAGRLPVLPPHLDAVLAPPLAPPPNAVAVTPAAPLARRVLAALQPAQQALAVVLAPWPACLASAANLSYRVTETLAAAYTAAPPAATAATAPGAAPLAPPAAGAPLPPFVALQAALCCPITQLPLTAPVFDVRRRCSVERTHALAGHADPSEVRPDFVMQRVVEVWQQHDGVDSPALWQALDEALTCCIDATLLTRAVLGTDGHTYDGKSIRRALRQNPCSPLTRAPMAARDLVPHHGIMRLAALVAQTTA